jgi:hypothetical protein
VAVGVSRDDDRGVAEALLDDLGRQLEPAVDPPVDAPAGVEVPHRVQPRVLAFPARGHDAGRTNAIESLNAKLRRAVRTRGHFPTDEAAIKLLYLVLHQVAQTWKMPPREWCEAKTQFAIMFDDRFVKA